MKLHHPFPNPPPLRGRGGWGVIEINTFVLVKCLVYLRIAEGTFLVNTV